MNLGQMTKDGKWREMGRQRADKRGGKCGRVMELRVELGGALEILYAALQSPAFPKIWRKCESKLHMRYVINTSKVHLKRPARYGGNTLCGVIN